MSDQKPQKPKERHPFHGAIGQSKAEQFQRDLDEAIKRREEMLKKFRNK